MTNRPIIGITMGDPVGIGPEIILKTLCEKMIYETCKPVVLGDVGLLSALNRSLKIGLDILGVENPKEGHYQHGTLDVIPISDIDLGLLQVARPSKETGLAMVKYITEGIDWTLKGIIQGLTTCPINKMAMHKAGFPFEGHTELLAARTKTSDYVMMLAGDKLRVALVTIHIALADVSRKLTADKILKTIQITESALKDSFGILRPRLAVAALNPHGGEEGLFGREETSTIVPAIEQASRDGIDVAGPYPADTLFYWALKGKWDAVICMYHDQGLIPFKMVHFTDGVNTTLGLPIVRTSVDHGTAYDIAGTGRADPGSLIAAISMAAHQAKERAGE